MRRWFDTVKRQIYHPRPMGQSGNRPELRHFISVLLSIAGLFIAGCDRSSSVVQSPRKAPTAASLSPAATDILVAIGAADHLVAVSNYDRSKSAVSELPGAGDYLTVDWERLAQLRPEVLIVQVRESAVPAGFKDNARNLNIRPVYIHIDHLEDIFIATRELGEALNEKEKAASAEKEVRDQLAAVAASVANRPRVITLVVTDEVGAGVAGPGTFLDELLSIAGGVNAAANEGSAYPEVDREKILALKPDVVLHLLPDKPARTIDEAKQFWASIPDVPAVKNGKVHFVTESSVMHPGLGVGNTAKIFADKLHPDRKAPMAQSASAPPARSAR